MRINIDIDQGGLYIEKYDVGVFLSWRDIRELEKVRKEETGKHAKGK